MKKFMIIDGSSLLYRAFFSLPPLQNALGVPTNAVYGFLTMFLKVYEQLQPDYVAVAFDKGKHTFRTELYPEYKGNRPSAPDDLRPQFPLIREVLAAMGIAVIEEEGFEGDDIIGSLSKAWGSDTLAVQIITGDRDTLQLVDAHSTVHLTKKGISEMLAVDTKNMESLYGYGPDKVIEMKSLMGDSSDNIPGVPGVGEKTALKLISQFGTLENLYDHLEEVSGKKLKEKLTDNKELAFLSRTLATIKTDMPFTYTIEDFVPAARGEGLQETFERLGFHQLIGRVTKILRLAEAATADVDLFTVFEAVDVHQGWESLTPAYYEGHTVALVIMTEGKAPFTVVQDAYAYNGETLLHLPVDEVSSYEKALTKLQALVNGCQCLITYRTKELIEALDSDKPYALEIMGTDGTYRVVDLLLMAYLLDPTRTNYTFAYLCERFGVGVVEEGMSLEAGLAMVKALYTMAEPAQQALADKELVTLYETIELPLIHTLAVMEKNGIYIEPVALSQMRERFATELNALQEEIYALAGEDFNINSPKQLGVILFEKLGLPVIRKTKTGYSTDAEVLDILYPHHPIIEKILSYRSVAKLLSTYLEGLEPLINKQTKRIHSSFNQMVTATGRLSSSDPNLQNIPVRTEKGKLIRSLFLPGEGYDYLVSADYSQIELRILAHLSGDGDLIRAFKEGKDIHRFTAAEVLGKPLEEVTPQERSHAKAVNFGIIYGISDFGLARDLGITREEAKDYIQLYFSRYPGIKGYMDDMVAQAHESGEVRTMFGRCRSLPDINNRNFNRRSFAERAAMNTPIQGTAADIIKLAMNQVAQRLKQEALTSRLLLQVHDELVLEVTAAELAKVEALLKETMEQVVDLAVPLEVDVHHAVTWAEVK